jgi:hypothetical protein
MVGVTSGKSAAGGYPPYMGGKFLRISSLRGAKVCKIVIRKGLRTKGVTAKFVQPKELRPALEKAPARWGLFSWVY